MQFASSFVFKGLKNLPPPLRGHNTGKCRRKSGRPYLLKRNPSLSSLHDIYTFLVHPSGAWSLCRTIWPTHSKSDGRWKFESGNWRPNALGVVWHKQNQRIRNHNLVSLLIWKARWLTGDFDTSADYNLDVDEEQECTPCWDGRKRGEFFHDFQALDLNFKHLNNSPSPSFSFSNSR
jgi:hypothetical protein